MGLFLMRMTNSYIANSWIHSPVLQETSESRLSVYFILRCLISLAGQIIHNTGLWALLDLHTTPWSPVRNCVMLAAGAVMLLVTQSFAQNFGVPVDSEEDIANERSKEFGGQLLIQKPKVQIQ